MPPTATITYPIYDVEPSIGADDSLHGYDVLGFFHEHDDGDVLDTFHLRELAAAAVADLQAGHSAPTYGPAMGQVLAELEARGYFGQEECSELGGG